MSEYPPPPPGPLGYETPALIQQSRRPASVTVIAIIAIIWGSLGAFGSLCGLAQQLGLNFGPNPVMDEMRKDPLLRWHGVISLAIATVLAVALLWAGVGALRLKPAGRITMIWYAVIELVFSIANIAFSLAVANPRMQQIVQNTIGSNPQLNIPAVKVGMQIGAFAGPVISAVLLIWPVLILYFMTRPRVKMAFAAGLY